MDRGFTLVELVLVLVLASILAVSLWPRAPSTASVTLNGRADQLASDIRYVQTLSMTRGQRYCFTLTPNTGPPYSGYNLTTAASGCVTLLPEGHPAGLSMPVQICGGSNCITVAPGLANNYIQFDGLGTPYSAPATTLAAGGVSITLTDGGSNKTVVVSDTTGRVLAP